MKALLTGIAITLSLASTASAGVTLSLGSRAPSSSAVTDMIAKAESDAGTASAPANSEGAADLGIPTGKVNKIALDLTRRLSQRIDISGKYAAREARGHANGGVEQALIVPEPTSVAVWCLVGLTSVIAGVSRRRNDRSC